jgi:hypothetical protein
MKLLHPAQNINFQFDFCSPRDRCKSLLRSSNMAETRKGEWHVYMGANLPLKQKGEIEKILQEVFKNYQDWNFQLKVTSDTFGNNIILIEVHSGRNRNGCILHQMRRTLMKVSK